ncbi:MAG: DNA-deoxyinosine glycosylase [Clostridia bacterium]|nr:DNA-deoxyinosine glycosylase [Clostridia bacterium]
METVSQAQTVTHPIPPFCAEGARVLILGSFPSVRSRESGFFYGHPQNRFWHVLARVFEDAVPATVEEKKAFLAAHGIALWDVIASCRIEGSADSSIRDVTPNDIPSLVRSHGIRAVFTNGKKAQALYDKHILPALGIPAVCLPSTSPANAAWSVERLTASWHALRQRS